LEATANISPERFAEGLTIQQFIDGMEKNKDLFSENYRKFELKPEDAAFLRDLGLDLNVTVLVEDWCGDVLRYVPALARVAEALPNWKVRLFYRDRNLDLSDRCLKDGKYRAIPAMMFFDEGMNELACWVEKPAAVYAEVAQARKEFAEQHSDLPDAALPIEDMSDTTREQYVTFIRQLGAGNHARWQQLFIDELKQRLAGGLVKVE
jgi:thiol-disulfide isomerase/thioredoxin